MQNDNSFTQEDPDTPSPEEPNPFALLTHSHHCPPGQFFLRNLKENIDAPEYIEDDSALVSPDYSPEPESQEPNPFAELSWKNPESQHAYEEADGAFEAGNEVTTTVGLLERGSVMPAHFVDSGVEPPNSLALAAVTMRMPGAPRITVG